MTTTSLPTTFLFIESYLYRELHSSLPSIWITVIEILNGGVCVCVCVCVNFLDQVTVTHFLTKMSHFLSTRRKTPDSEKEE